MIKLRNDNKVFENGTVLLTVQLKNMVC